MELWGGGGWSFPARGQSVKRREQIGLKQNKKQVTQKARKSEGYSSNSSPPKKPFKLFAYVHVSADGSWRKHGRKFWGGNVTVHVGVWYTTVSMSTRYTQSGEVAVYAAPAERANTLPLFNLYPYVLCEFVQKSQHPF